MAGLQSEKKLSTDGTRFGGQRVFFFRRSRVSAGSAYRYHPCADSGGRRRTHAVLRSVCLQPIIFFHTANSPCSQPRATVSEDNAALGQLTGKPAGARPDYRGRCVSLESSVAEELRKRHGDGSFTHDMTTVLDSIAAKEFLNWVMNSKTSEAR
ncbi:UNVERIFIED_CONTAM: hypothetical protein FKN15_059677 [Acipenser sinensis]